MFYQVILDVSRRIDVWHSYSMFMVRAGYSREEILSYQTFVNMWRKDVPYMKTRQAKTIESKCYVCEDLEVSSHMVCVMVQHPHVCSLAYHQLLS